MYMVAPAGVEATLSSTVCGVGATLVVLGVSVGVVPSAVCFAGFLSTLSAVFSTCVEGVEGVPAGFAFSTLVWVVSFGLAVS